MADQPSNAAGRPDLLVGFLADRDAPCPVCGYNLRALGASRCPECSSPLELAVASPNLNPGPWVTTMVSLAMGMGFDVVVTVIIASVLTIKGLPPNPAGRVFVGMAVATFVVLTAACGGCLLATYRRRKSWATRPVRQQWRWAVAVFLLTFGVHGAVGLWMSGLL